MAFNIKKNNAQKNIVFLCVRCLVIVTSIMYSGVMGKINEGRGKNLNKEEIGIEN